MADSTIFLDKSTMLCEAVRDYIYKNRINEYINCQEFIDVLLHKLQQLLNIEVHPTEDQYQQMIVIIENITNQFRNSDITKCPVHNNYCFNQGCIDIFEILRSNFAENNDTDLPTIFEMLENDQQVLCNDLRIALDKNDIVWKLISQQEECKIQGLTSWCSIRWMFTPYVGQALVDYTYYGDKAINNYLRNGTLAEETFKYVKDNYDPKQISNRKDRAFAQYKKLVNDYSVDKIETRIHYIDNYLMNHAPRFQNDAFLYRGQNDIDNLKVNQYVRQSSYTSTTYSRNVAERFLNRDDSCQICCFLILRVRKNVPFIALNLISDAVDEDEILLPRNMYIKLYDTETICFNHTRQVKIYFCDCVLEN